MWKTLGIIFILPLIITLAAPMGCSSTKATRKAVPKHLSPDVTLVANDREGVKKRLGEPTTVSKTPEGRILWVYEPQWKIMPDNKGTLYLEFENDKVTKVFRTK
jgi:hypothetical protein